MKEIKDLLAAILDEQKKTNMLVERFVNDSKEAQSKAMEMAESQKVQAFEMVQKASPKMAEMLKGFVHGN